MRQAWAILLTILALLVGSWFYSYYWCPWESPEMLQTAQISYNDGERGTTIAERKDNFNQALSSYQKLEKHYYPENGSGKLFFNLGNAYYQLEQYPWAALYYYKAQRLMPREDKPLFNLGLTLDKLQQPRPPAPTIWEKIFLVRTYLSIPEAIQLFALITFIVFALATFMIWYPKRFLKPLMVLFCGILLFLGAALTYQKYIAPLNAVVVKATPVYRDAGTQFSQVQNDPLPAGVKVEILQIMPDGNWIKILLPQGAIGFVPMESLRII